MEASKMSVGNPMSPPQLSSSNLNLSSSSNLNNTEVIGQQQPAKVTSTSTSSPLTPYLPQTFDIRYKYHICTLKTS